MTRQVTQPFPNRLLKRPGALHRARLLIGQTVFDCQIGKAGFTGNKKEGDMKTPVRRLCLLYGCYRADRVKRPILPVPLYPIARKDGWCDAPFHPAYNRHVGLPFAASHEKLWRDDPLYDLVFVLDWNIFPRRKGRGSAIFLHLSREDGQGTEGCIALPRQKLLQFLRLAYTNRPKPRY